MKDKTCYTCGLKPTCDINSARKCCSRWISEKEQKKYDDAHKEYFEELDRMHKRNAEFLENIEKQVEPEYFKCILYEIEESENTGNYRIVDSPVGEPQYNKEGDYTCWVYQRSRGSEDSYYGTVCVSLNNGTYFIWDFEI